MSTGLLVLTAIRFLVEAGALVLMVGVLLRAFVWLLDKLCV